MKKEERLEIQAWIDGELPPPRTAQTANLVQSNDQAQALADEMRAVQSSLRIGEDQAQLDDSRDFYWSQIESQIELQIEAEEPIPAVLEPKLSPSPVASLMRWVVPAGSLAAIFALVITFGTMSNINSKDDFAPDTAPFLSRPAQTPSANTGHTESSGMMEGGELDGSLEIFRFEGSQGSGNLIDPEDPNSLPESIENPER